MTMKKPPAGFKIKVQPLHNILLQKGNELSVTEFEELIKTHISELNAFSSGSTILSWAVVNAKYDFLEVLMRYRADPNVVSRHFETPIMEAAWLGDERAFKMLIANYDYLDLGVFNKKNQSIMHLAAQGKSTFIVEYLLGKYKEIKWDLNCIDNDGMYPLSYAIKFDQVEIVKLLLDSGFSKLSEKNRDNYKPIHWAAIFNATESLKYLINLGANKNSITREADTPLHLGVHFRSFACINILLNTRPLPHLYVRNRWGQTFYDNIRTSIGEPYEHLIDFDLNGHGNHLPNPFL